MKRRKSTPPAKPVGLSTVIVGWRASKVADVAAAVGCYCGALLPNGGVVVNYKTYFPKEHKLRSDTYIGAVEELKQEMSRTQKRIVLTGFGRREKVVDDFICGKRQFFAIYALAE